MRNQEELMQLNPTNPREFYKKIGITTNRKSEVPWEVIDNDGVINSDRKSVLNRWKNYFPNLLNYEHDYMQT